MPLKDSKTRWLAVPMAAILSSASIGVSMAMPRPVTRMPHVMSSLDHINRQTAEIMVALNDELALTSLQQGSAGLVAAVRWEGRVKGPLRVIRAAAEDYAHTRGDEVRVLQLQEICDRMEGALSRAFAAQGARIAALADLPADRSSTTGSDPSRRFAASSLDLELAVRQAEREGIAANEWVAAILDE